MELEEVEGNRWFNRELIRKVGNGLETYFWKDAWITSVPFMDFFSAPSHLSKLSRCEGGGGVGKECGWREMGASLV